jgi:DNA transformation protein
MSPSRKRGADSGFVEFVRDQLSDLGSVTVRTMFGGHGFYCAGAFFGIVFQGRVYFRADAETKKQYCARGMTPFRPSPKQTLKNYYEVPADVLEDPDLAVAWAKRAVAGARRTGSENPVLQFCPPLPAKKR